MKIAPVSDIKARFSAFLKATKKGPVVVTKNGRPVAVMLSVVSEEELERLLLAHSPKVQAILDKGREQLIEGEGILHDDFWQEVEAETV